MLQFILLCFLSLLKTKGNKKRLFCRKKFVRIKFFEILEIKQKKLINNSILTKMKKSEIKLSVYELVFINSEILIVTIDKSNLNLSVYYNEKKGFIGSFFECFYNKVSFYLFENQKNIFRY